MSDYPLFIPEFMLYTKSSLLWFKITTKLREFRNYLFVNKHDASHYNKRIHGQQIRFGESYQAIQTVWYSIATTISSKIKIIYIETY